MTETKSFGTYSCEIKGVENSFSAMEEIAQYFDGLNADRNSADPAVPDADRLAEIAADALGCAFSVSQKDRHFMLHPIETARAVHWQVPDPSAQAHIDDSRFRNESLAERLQRIRGMASGEEPVTAPPEPAPEKTPAQTLTDEDRTRLETAEFLALLHRGKPSPEEPPVPAAEKPSPEQEPEPAPKANAGFDSDPAGRPQTPAPVVADPDIGTTPADEQLTTGAPQRAEPQVPNEIKAQTDAPLNRVPPMWRETLLEAVHQVGPPETAPTEKPAATQTDNPAPGHTPDSEQGVESANPYIAANPLTGDADDPGNAPNDLPPPNTDQTGDPATVHESARETLASPPSDQAPLAEQPELDRGIQSVVRNDRANRALNSKTSVKDEEDIWRLLDETNLKLDSTVVHHRHSVFSHLKAAVTAKFSDGSGKGNQEEKSPKPDETAPYRTDLADVVRPTSAVSKPPAPPEPDPDQTEPLILAGEQSIEPDKASTSKSFADTSFAEYAGEMGAANVLSLTEAAAAYCGHLQGQPDFPRSDVLNLVEKTMGSDRFKRKEGLRAFGKLLRRGKIVIVRRGRFALTDKSRYFSSSPD